MKWLKGLLGVGVLGFCIVGTMRFIQLDNPSNNIVKSEEPETTTQTGEEMTSKKMGKSDIWNKIASSYMEGAVCEETSSKVRQEDWIYQVDSAKITKKRDPKWDFVPDYEEYQYDKDENLINEYSYVTIDLTIQCKRDTTLEHHYNLPLNSIWLGIFDKDGEMLSGGEMQTASLGKKESKSYFFYDLKEGETLQTTVVFIIEDEFLTEDNYYVMDINNPGVIQSLEDFDLIKLPLGVEKHETNSKE